jgi:HD-GYP domain-containing protein (c-di-GMP phosphodiesterase class II)
MLQGIDFLKDATEIVYAHHEYYDGSGYPRGLKGDEIPLGARIFAVVDAYDAITSYRPYRKAQPHCKALDEIVRNSGTQFDPEVVQAFLKADKQGLLEERRWDGRRGPETAGPDVEAAVASPVPD